VSIKIMTWVWDNSPYTGDKLLMHLALADTAHDNGSLWMTQAHLAKKVRCSENWVWQFLKQMQEDGWIEVTQKGHRGRATTYQLVKDNPNKVSHNIQTNNPNSNSFNPNSNTFDPNFAGVHPSYTSILTSKNESDDSSTQLEVVKVKEIAPINLARTVADKWWKLQNPRPIGKSAWHALLSVVEASVERGYSDDQIFNALNKIGTVPSLSRMDIELKSFRPERVSSNTLQAHKAMALSEKFRESNG
jgi:biotin operon repressor